MVSSSGPAATRGRLRFAALVGACIIALAILLLAAFPWGLLADRAGAPLSALIGRRVTIGSARRLDHLSFTPTIELRDVRIAQPDWAGREEFGHIDHIIVRFRALPMLLGRFEPIAIIGDGMVVRLHRFSDGRENWRDPRRRRQSRTSPALRFVTIRNSRLELRNDKREVLLTAGVAVDPQHGLVIAGSGTHRDQPVAVRISGPPVTEATADKPYPVALSVHSSILTLDVTGKLDRPLDLEHYDAEIRASGRNLTYLDDILQAGLFDTQPFRFVAKIRHDAPDWTIKSLSGSIGHSLVAASGAVRLRNGRTRLAMEVDAERLDFDDLASDSQHDEAKARTGRIGKRILPHTRIRLDHVARLDGTMHLRARTLLGPAGSPFRSLDATVSLDHQVLKVKPLNVGLTHGRLTGALTLDDRNDRHDLTINARLSNARLADFMGPGDAIEAPVDGRLVFNGKGAFFDEAMGRADGQFGVVARSGSVRRDVALYASGDALKTITAAIGKPASRVPLRCLVGDFDARRGVLVPRLLAFSTDRSRADGTGSVRLSDERVDLSFTGRAFHPGLLQSTAPLHLGGTLAAIHVAPSTQAGTSLPKHKGLGEVGAFLQGLKTRGDEGRSAPAPPLDCAAAGKAALAG